MDGEMDRVCGILSIPKLMKLQMYPVESQANYFQSVINGVCQTHTLPQKKNQFLATGQMLYTIGGGRLMYRNYTPELTLAHYL